MQRTWLGIVLAIALTACGGGGMNGTYSDDSGIVSYEFKGNGKVLVSSMGQTVELQYEKDGDKIRVMAAKNAPAQVITITDDGHLDVGMAVLKKQD